MLASPSIQEIASALARTRHLSQALNLPRTGRTLCLKLQALPSPGFKRRFTDTEGSLAEAFLKYSPRVSTRISREGALFVFIDIASTSHLFAGSEEREDSPVPENFNPGEESLMRSAIRLARDLGFGAQCAVADTPVGAQAFATAQPGIIIPPGEERDRLKELSLPLLLHMEGVVSWDKNTAIESIITFFMMLGFRTIGDLSRFTAESFQERWSAIGSTLWKRLNAQDRQVISPLLPTEPLTDYAHLDFPVSLVSLLLHQVNKSLSFLFSRLQGRRLMARRLTLTLHCEYSNTQHKIDIEPVSPSRDRDLFLTLIENRLSHFDLENPVRDLEVHIDPVPEKSHQFDFFEPRVNDRDKVETLVNLLSQSNLQPGFYHIEPSLLPEGGWRVESSPHACDTAISLLSPRDIETCRDEESETPAVLPRPHYGTPVMRAPRPTRLLKTPRPLPLDELEQIKILSHTPIERLEGHWWTSDGAIRRDYYFAVSPEGQCLWIYQDSRTEEYFLHGYFD